MNVNSKKAYLFKNNKLNIVQNLEKSYLINAENVWLPINSGNYNPAEKNYESKNNNINCLLGRR